MISICLILWRELFFSVFCRKKISCSCWSEIEMLRNSAPAGDRRNDFGKRWNSAVETVILCIRWTTRSSPGSECQSLLTDISSELCGGPHVTHTGELQGFKIKKEESSAAGVRRIKAVVGKFD